MKDQSILPEENISLESGCLSKEDVIACAVGLVLRNCSEMEKEKLERIIDAGRYTATAKNAQASPFVVVQEKLAEFKTIFWEELPSVLETLQEAAPAYVRPFRLFYEKWKRNPQDDTFSLTRPAFC